MASQWVEAVRQTRAGMHEPKRKPGVRVGSLKRELLTMQPGKPQQSTPRRPREMGLLAGLVLAFAVLLFAALVLLGTATKQRESVKWVAHSHEVLDHIDHLVTYLSDVENGRRGFVITGEDRYLAHFTNGQMRVEEALRTLRDLTADNTFQTEACDELAALIQKRLEIFTHSINARRARGLDVVEQTVFIEQGQQAMEPIRQLAERMTAHETDLLAERQARQSKEVEGGLGFAVLVSLIGLLLFITLLLLIARANRRRQAAELELTQANAELEQRVQQRTSELQAANAEVLRVNAELDQRVQERTAQLEDANKELEAFSYSVSHDLRAPLRHIQGYAEMLQQATAGQLTEKSGRYLQTITKASSEMGQLIDDLLAFSRIGRAELQSSHVPLERVVQQTIQRMELALKDRRIDWKIGSLPVVVGDPTALGQVFANLIGNAVKYTSQREVARIEIGLAGQEDGHIILFVRDNGAGFDMQYVDKLFGVFQRLHRADEFEGTGIGLATVRRVIARHGGRTWAEGAVEQGATIFFTLKPASANPD